MLLQNVIENMAKNKCIFYSAKAKPFLSPDNRYFLLPGQRLCTFSFVTKPGQHFQVGFNYTALTAPTAPTAPSYYPRPKWRISAFLFAIVACANSRRLCKRRRRPLCKVIEAQRPCTHLQIFISLHSLSSKWIEHSKRKRKLEMEGPRPERSLLAI